MSAHPADARVVWRVGYHADPLGFTPRELCAWNHRFDDCDQRFRTVYVAEAPETSLREVLADFRPNLAAIERYRDAMGEDAATELPATPVTASWRRQHVLAAVRAVLDGPLCDLTDVAERHAVESAHAALLREHGMQHLDLHEVTSRRRVVTQTIAARLFDAGVAGIRFPSRLDGGPRLALFEGRGRLSLVAAPLPLTDPAPEVLATIADEWRLALEPAPPPDDDQGWSDEATARTIAEEPW